MSAGECEQATAIELARHDERLKALVQDIARAEESSRAAVKLAADELARRLDLLNHSHEQTREAQITYLPRETYQTRIDLMEARLTALEGQARETMGRIWLPMILAGTIAAGVVALTFRLLR